MNTNLTTFSFHNKPIRVVEIDGNPWFAATDVLKVLDYTINQRTGSPNVSMALSHLDSGEVSINRFEGKGQYAVKIISESGLYKLVMRSDKPEARTFQDWVTREVLPSIRKTGAFVTGQPSIQENPNMDPLDLLMAQAELLPKLITQLREQRAIQKVHEEKLAS